MEAGPLKRVSMLLVWHWKRGLRRWLPTLQDFWNGYHRKPQGFHGANAS
jgi:hypothetical protein